MPALASVNETRSNRKVGDPKVFGQDFSNSHGQDLRLWVSFHLLP